MAEQVVLITGAAKRVGAVIARTLHHARDCFVVIHYHRSQQEAKALCDSLNQQRPNSAAILMGDLTHIDELSDMVTQATQCFGRLDVFD